MLIFKSWESYKFDNDEFIKLVDHYTPSDRIVQKLEMKYLNKIKGANSNSALGASSLKQSDGGSATNGRKKT